ncbi:MAG: DedA family protein [Candidatus Shapirobacteria bacterium]|nr:DedA family protein [Candidatus Shapirobacteria bacterium]
MNFIKTLIDLFLHIDKNLALVIANFGGWSYAMLWFVIFMETGLVVTPFLPGDSLLFAAAAFAGATASQGSFNIYLLWFLMVLAAFVGDTVNYWIGHFIGPKAFTMKSGLLKKEYLDKAQAFYDKHGGIAIVLARFVPIVRTFAPFVAGVGKMHYGKFISYNAVGGLLWVTLFTFGGYFFGNIPFVKANFELVVVVIVLISVVPIMMEWVKSKRRV